ncbi:MAG: phosphoribosylanthranilate isomerase [Pseudomonadota bacterium]
MTSELLSPPIIKICGVTSLDAALAATDSGADMIGLVFVEKSPRAISADAAIALAQSVRERRDHPPRFVGLFVDADDAAIGVAAPALDGLQCHGAETPARIAAIKETFKLPVMKALPVGAAADLAAAEAFEGIADAFLFDARPPKGAVVTGGHGVVFDWSVLRAYKGPTRFLLAGGLVPENVARAIAALRGLPGFAGVDVSSGVESKRGVKDLNKIRAFTCTAAQAWDEPAF